MGTMINNPVNTEVHGVIHFLLDKNNSSVGIHKSLRHYVIVTLRNHVIYIRADQGMFMTE